MFEHAHPAYQHWLKWGREVRKLHEQGVIRGLVFVSAHWQAEDLKQGVYGRSKSACRRHPEARSSLTQYFCQLLVSTVNVDEKNPVVYDFYNFPDHFVGAKRRCV